MNSLKTAFSSLALAGLLAGTAIVHAGGNHDHGEGGHAHDMQAMGDQPLHVMQAWVRPTVAAQKATGGYMTVMAHADGKIVGATSDLAASTEVHEMSMDGDIMRMRQVKAIEVTEGDFIQFEPGGYHVMFMGLKQPIAKDTKVVFNLVFEATDGTLTEVPVAATAKMAGAGGGHDHDHGHSHDHGHNH